MGIAPLRSPEIMAGQAGGERSYGPLAASATVASLRPAVSGDSGTSTGSLLQVPLLAEEKRSRPHLSVLSGLSGILPPSGEVRSPHLTTETTSDSGVVSRVLAGIDAVGSAPAEVSVYSQPMGRSIVTDVVVHETDQGDGTKKIGNHWQSAQVPASAPPVADGIGSAGLRVGAYEESRNAAREAYMMFQGMKLNQTA